MKFLKLASALLDYPRDELWAHREELVAASADRWLSPARQEQLGAFVVDLLERDPLDAQSRWLELFDRGRSMSLLLFEHIHGESRNRGQAMVDLMEAYREGGFEVVSRELPDYLPLVLEYLSQRQEAHARDWLHHVAHILELLAARAHERHSPYATLFEVLIEFAKGKVDLQPMLKRAANEARDDTREAIDRVWEEEAVRFGADAPTDDCAPPGRVPAASAAANNQVTP